MAATLVSDRVDVGGPGRALAWQRSYDDRVTRLEERHEELRRLLDKVEIKLDKVEGKLDALKEVQAGQARTLALISWIGGTMGLVIITFLVGGVLGHSFVPVPPPAVASHP